MKRERENRKRGREKRKNDSEEMERMMDGEKAERKRYKEKR